LISHYYYQVSVPLKLKISLTYISSQIITKGCRVLVSVGRNLYTGIIVSEPTDHPLLEKNKAIRYKTIFEVIDVEPIISESMLKLAYWMSDYYKTALGIVIDTMMPLALKHQVTQKIRLRINDNISWSDTPLGKTQKAIYNALQNSTDWVQISSLRAIVKSINFYHALEELEKSQIIEVFRTFDEKIKPKYVNFVRVLDITQNNNLALQKLSEKQYEAWKLINLQLGIKIDHGIFIEDQELLNCSGTLTNSEIQENKQLILSSESFNQIQQNKEIALTQLVNRISYTILKSLKKKKLIDIYPKKIDLELFNYPKPKETITIRHNDEQKKAILEITKAITQNTFRTFLLYGITGSGKTEIYIEAIKYCQMLNKSAMMLVPEISLTPQAVYRFFHVFGKNIAVLHSNLSDRERFLQWKLIAQGKITIVIGARSAIFAPIKNPGLIIVDEEHESSYKQEHQPCYNGRDLAVKRGNLEEAVVILGSATPSIESWSNALQKKYSLLSLTARPAGAILPEVQIIDMKKEEFGVFISETLKKKIQNRLEMKEQIILFHNRRGYANFVQCINCGNIFKCPHCDISMTYHKTENQIVCHYCGFRDDNPRKCPTCGSYHFVYGFPGTEQIDIQLRLFFPSAKILRMDSDTTKKKDSYNEMFTSMNNHHIDILIGTQMISKGLDFHNVTLVGVILADVLLNIPDYRSTERTFQLLTQVAGRSGRGNKKGEVIIQTRNPQHYALLHAAKQDFVSFTKQELVVRQEVYYPPYYKLSRILFSSSDETLLKETLISNHLLLIKLKKMFPAEEIIIFPFIQAPLPKIKGKYRYHFIIKSKKIQYIQKFLDYFLQEFSCSLKIDMVIDIDPLSLM